MAANTLNLSVAGPISAAVDRVRLVLFQPFDLEKWLTLGFCAFLANLGRGGGGGGGGHWGGHGGDLHVRPMVEWIESNLAWVVFGALGIGVIVLALMLLFAWLSSRGEFMFVDGVVRNRAAVKEPWAVYAQSGNRLFLFTFLLWLALSLFVAITLGSSLAWAWPDIQADRFGDRSLVAILCGIGVLFPTLLGSWIAHVVLRDFVVPAMYLRPQPVLAGFSSVWEEIMRPHLGIVVLYFIVKILLGLVIGLLAVIVTCLTCCLAALPYIGTVILLPLLVFKRSFSLCFLQQFGPAWDCFAPAPSPAQTH